MKLETLQELFVEELKDLYSAENMLVKALPKMAKAATSQDLKAGFEEHLRQTVRYSPDHFEAHLKLGQVLLARGEAELGKAELRKASASPDAQIRAAAADALKRMK